MQGSISSQLERKLGRRIRRGGRGKELVWTVSTQSEGKSGGQDQKGNSQKLPGKRLPQRCEKKETRVKAHTPRLEAGKKQ